MNPRMHGYYYRKPVRPQPSLIDGRKDLNTAPPSLNNREERVPSRKTDPLSPKERKQDAHSLLPDIRDASENGQDYPLKYHIAGIANTIHSRFKDLSLMARIVLAMFALYTLFILVNILIQMIISSMNEIYTILGILASAIIVYEFVFRGSERNSK